MTWGARGYALDATIVRRSEGEVKNFGESF